MSEQYVIACTLRRGKDTRPSSSNPMTLENAQKLMGVIKRANGVGVAFGGQVVTDAQLIKTTTEVVDSFTRKE